MSDAIHQDSEPQRYEVTVADCALPFPKRRWQSVYLWARNEDQARGDGLKLLRLMQVKLRGLTVWVRKWRPEEDKELLRMGFVRRIETREVANVQR
jgi:hypothetical protein